MPPPKVDAVDYIQFLIAAQRVYTGTEAARSQPEEGLETAPAHDAFTRLLTRQPPDTEALWQEEEPRAEREAGILVLDDTTLDKPHAKKIELVTRHWSGARSEARQLSPSGLWHQPSDAALVGGKGKFAL